MPVLNELFADKPWFIVFLIFSLSTLIQLIWYTGIYGRFVFHRKKPVVENTDPVTVIICARNEAENLEQYLPVVLTQDYPNYEVVVVDDCSTDDTDMVLTRMKALYPHLRTSVIKEDKKFSHGKKLAVTIGIKAARNENLLFIDADCVPDGDQWLKQMSAPFSEKVELVLGYGGFFNEPGLLNKYIRLDTLLIALQYFSFALWKIPYMGVGRNMAYKRSLFYAGKGFTSHFHLASGDDDLFVNEHANRENTAVVFSTGSHTRSSAKQSFQRWSFQKKRHFSTASRYKKIHGFLLTLEPFTRLCYYAGFATLLFYQPLQITALSVFGIRLLIQLIVIKKAMMRLNEKNLLVISLLYDLSSIFINSGLYMSSRFRPTNYQWK
jgi:glycosyltransferase involved in cell wall biosynthesis